LRNLHDLPFVALAPMWTPAPCRSGLRRCGLDCVRDRARYRFKMHLHSRARFSIALVVLASGSHASAEPRIPTHVACIGDSITAGYLASSSAASYPSQLADLLTAGGHTADVQNFGVSGATMMRSGDMPYWNQSQFTSAQSFIT